MNTHIESLNLVGIRSTASVISPRQNGTRPYQSGVRWLLCSLSPFPIRFSLSAQGSGPG